MPNLPIFCRSNPFDIADLTFRALSLPPRPAAVRTDWLKESVAGLEEDAAYHQRQIDFHNLQIARSTTQLQKHEADLALANSEIAEARTQLAKMEAAQ
jgi:hypothetical protein